MVIEIDGGIHLSAEIKRNDKIKEEFMQSLGLQIIRFTNEEVCEKSENVIEKLKKVINHLKNNF